MDEGAADGAPWRLRVDVVIPTLRADVDKLARTTAVDVPAAFAGLRFIVVVDGGEDAAARVRDELKRRDDARGGDDPAAALARARRQQRVRVLASAAHYRADVLAARRTVPVLSLIHI